MDDIQNLRMLLVNAVRVMDQLQAHLRDAGAISPSVRDQLIKQLQAARDTIEDLQSGGDHGEHS
jgi:hypothetical protein